MGRLDAVRQFNLLSWLREERRSRKLSLFIVFVALLLDNMLMTVVVPILPSYLYGLDELAEMALKNHTLTQQAPAGAFHSIVSLYDNTVRTAGPNTTVSSTDPPLLQSCHRTPPNAPCPAAGCSRRM